MGDLQSEEERDVVLELKLPAILEPEQDTVLQTTISYFNVITSKMESSQSKLILSRRGENLSVTYILLSTACAMHKSSYFYPLLISLIDGDMGDPNRIVDIQRNRIRACAAMKEAEPLADQGTNACMS